jgi:iron complex outermembrane receptor protein
MNASVGWSFRQFQSTLYFERYGSLPNWAETGRIGAVHYFNLSAGYSFLNDRAQASIFVDNLLDKDPPRDSTYDTYPYFSSDNYSAIGREVFLQVRYDFGGP